MKRKENHLKQTSMVGHVEPPLIFRGVDLIVHLKMHFKNKTFQWLEVLLWKRCSNHFATGLFGKKRDRSPCIWTRLDDRTPDFCSTFFLCSESFLNGVHPSAGLRSLIWAKFMPAAILISKLIVKRLAIAAKTAP